MAKMLQESDLNVADLLSGRRIAVLGFGSQGEAHALNLRDSGYDVRIGLRPGSASWDRAAALGLSVCSVEEAVGQADIVVFLVPDEVQPQVYEESLAGGLRPRATLLFAHGYSVHYGHIIPRDDLDVVMVAPFGIGARVRSEFVAGRGTPGQIAVAQDASGEARAVALAYARALGHARIGILETTFQEETETDLFAEQAVLCGGLTYLIEAGFETLVDAGYQPEVAYYSCLHEVKLIADIIYEQGLAALRDQISSTAAYGGLVAGPQIINEQSRIAMRELLGDIRSRRFDKDLSREMASGQPALVRERSRTRAHQLEEVGGRLRALAASHKNDAPVPVKDDKG